MDSIPYDSMILLGVLLLISGYFSAAEMALVSINRIRLRKLTDISETNGKSALALLENFGASLSALSVGKTLMNIIAVVIAVKAATDIFGGGSSVLLASTVVVACTILIISEILPKSLAKRNAEKYLLFTSKSLTAVMKILYPFTRFFVKTNQEEPLVTDEDFKVMVDIGEEEGTFLTQEKELLHNAIEFDDIVVKDILTPRPDVVAIANTATVEQIKEIFIQEKYSRIPVYEGSIDNIIGILSYHDFFAKYLQEAEFKLDEIIRKPYFVLGSVKISDLLKELQKSKNPLAIVLDEYGGTSGIVSIEDIIEEIVGDIWDEHDENDMMVELVDEGKYRVAGKISIDEFSETFEVEAPETTSYTLSGWIMDTLGNIPKKGEMIYHQNLMIVVEEVNNRRIQKVGVHVQEQVDTTDVEDATQIA